MTMIRIPGVKSYANEGERHFYLRRAGERIIDSVSPRSGSIPRAIFPSSWPARRTR
jgi:hypothetical protein